MEYPRIPHDEKKNVKITSEKLSAIISLRQNNVPVKQIAEKFNVTTECIYYWINPAYREKRKKQALDYIKRMLKDPNFRKDMKRRFEEWKNKRVDEDLDFKKWIHLEMHKNKKHVRRNWNPRKIKFAQFMARIEGNEKILKNMRGERLVCDFCNKVCKQNDTLCSHCGVIFVN